MKRPRKCSECGRWHPLDASRARNGFMTWEESERRDRLRKMMLDGKVHRTTN